MERKGYGTTDADWLKLGVPPHLLDDVKANAPAVEARVVAMLDRAIAFIQSRIERDELPGEAQ